MRDFFVNRWVMLLRMHRPAPIMLIVLPCWWGLASAGAGFKDYLIFTFAAAVMRGAGCVCNDIWDRDFDRQVSRTQSRPLAGGRVTVTQAVAVCLACCAAGGAVWLCYLHAAARLWSLAGLVVLVLYPTAKRWTQWPQLVLGAGFNLGAVVAAAQFGVPVPWGFYLWGICWTLAYDTVYAFQDVKDDLKLGLGSLAVRFRNSPKRFVGSVYAVQWVLLSVSLVFHAGYPAAYALAAASALTLAMCLLLWRWNPEVGEACARYFLLHIPAGFCLWLLLL